MIGGGTVFKGYESYLSYLRRYKIENLESLKYRDWKSDLERVLGSEFELVYPKMPCKEDAKYLEWKIWLKKLFPFLRNDIILIGHSLGGTFWLKYLAENGFPNRISQLHLVSAPVSNDKEFLGDFVPPEDLSNIAKLANNIYLYYSQDDSVVPFSELQKILSKLPSAKTIVLQNYGHFRTKEFPELIKRLRKIDRA